MNIIELAEKLGYRLLSAGTGKKKMFCIYPEHQETRPSLYLYETTDSFYCFGCRRGGKGIDKFYAVARGISPEQARAELRSQNIGLSLIHISEPTRPY